MKKWIKVTLTVIAIILVAVSIAAGLLFWYYPRYASSKVFYDVSEKTSDEVTVMSYNIRCYAPEDTFKKSWFYRADLVIENIASQEPDVIAFQEVNPIHLKFLKTHLKGYSFVNAYRTKTGTKEGLAIAYRTELFEALNDGYYWISDTPEKESKDWGTAFPRIALYATLKNVKTGKTFTVVDVHLDHVSQEARKEGMRVLVEQKEKLGFSSMILLGDMNDYEDSLMYKQAIDSGLLDAKNVADDVYAGSGCTYQKFGAKLNERRIDYFFLTPDIGVSSYSVADKTYDGVYPSDHFPLVIKLK